MVGVSVTALYQQSWPYTVPLHALPDAVTLILDNIQCTDNSHSLACTARCCGADRE